MHYMYTFEFSCSSVFGGFTVEAVPFSLCVLIKIIMVILVQIQNTYFTSEVVIGRTIEIS